MRPCFDAELWQAYRETLFEARIGDRVVPIRVGQRHADLDALFEARGTNAWCFITAWNPRSEPRLLAENRARNERLAEALVAMGCQLFPGAGRHPSGVWPPEESFIAFGIDRTAAMQLGRRFEQNAVVWGERGGEAELVACCESAALRDRIEGALLGTAIGDCLGAPIEGWRPREIASSHGRLCDYVYDAPIWTDDTQQSLVLAESLIRHGRPDPDWIGRRFVEMRDAYPARRFGVHRGTGSGFCSAVDAFAKSGDWRRSGRADRAGNGAAMRMPAFGAALAASRDDELAGAVLDASLLTHREGRALAGALAIARLAAQLTTEEAFPLPPSRARTLLGELGDWTEEREAWMRQERREISVELAEHAHDFSRVLRLMHGAFDGGWEVMRVEIEAFARTRHETQNFASAGFVLCSVAAALGLVLSSSDSIEETLVRTVNLGGDADTIGAMVGGLLGAATGTSRFPERWRRFPGREEVGAVGRALAALGEGGAGLPDLLALEIALTRQLDGSR